MIKKFEVVKALDDMAIIDEQVVRLEAEKQAKIDSVLTPEIRQAIQDINDEFTPMIDQAKENRSSLEKLAREGCLEFGETIKGNMVPGFQVVWSKGKMTWDMDAVMKRIKDDPTFKDLFTEGKPYTTIRKVSAPEKKDE